MSMLDDELVRSMALAIPEFTLDSTRSVAMKSGAVATLLSVPLRWDIKERGGAKLRFDLDSGRKFEHLNTGAPCKTMHNVDPRCAYSSKSCDTCR
jgi:hypothetical protein